MPEPVSERRIVSVVFAQVTGSPPDDALLTALRTCVERHGGTVDKFIGDVVMAVFGAPVAHGDDTARSLRASLAMRSAARAAARDLRAGVNRGEVFWGSVGGDRPTAIGDAVNVAQRLQAAADAGTVLASRSAWESSGDAFEGSPCGELELKGRSEAVVTWRIEPLPAGATRRGMPGERPTPFLGRDDALRDLLARFESGRGGLITVRGGPGCGKSRLLAEFRRLVRLRHPGAWVVTGRASEVASLPRAVFGEIARDGTGVDGAEDPGLLASALARDLEALPAAEGERASRADLMVLSLGFPVRGAATREMEPRRLREETAHAWSRWIRARAARGPVLLCLEDLQWADSGSRELLEDIAGALEGLPVTLAGAARPEAPPFRGAATLELDDLSPGASLEIASAVLGGSVTEGLAAFLAARAGGNPLYVEELCRFLRDRTLVHGPPFALSTGAAGIPAALQDILVAQADLLPAAAKESLKTAGVIGATFWLGLLGRLVRREASAEVREAQRRSMVAPRDSSLLPGDAEYVFRHALIRDAVYSLVPKKDRARLHALIADDLCAPGRPSRMDLLALAAHHAEAGGDAPRAGGLWMGVHEATLTESTVEQSLRAAREAARLGFGTKAILAEAEALTRLGRAEESLQRLNSVREGMAGPEPTAVALARSAALLNLGRMEESLGEARRAETLAATPFQRLSARSLEAKIFELLGKATLADPVVRDSLKMLEDPGLPGGEEKESLLAGFLDMDAILAWGRGEHQRAYDSNARALDISRRLGNRVNIASRLFNHAVHLRVLGRQDEALVSSLEALRFRRDLGDRAGICMSLSSVSAGLFTVGRFSETLPFLREAAAIARDSKTPETLSRVLLNLGLSLAKLGELGEALEAALEALELRRALSGGRPLVFAMTTVAHVYLARGEAAEGLAILLEAERVCRASAPEMLVEVLYNLSRAKADSGDAVEALRLAEEALHESQCRPNPGMQPLLSENLSRLRVRAGDPVEAVRLAKEALALRRGQSSTAELGPALLSLSEALLASGDAAGAEGCAAQALEEAGRLKVRLGEGWARLDRSRALFALGEVSEANAELLAARRVFGTLGAPALVEAASWIRLD